MLKRQVRLIELFAGIGAQAKALENLGVDFEHYKAVEFDKYAIASYNAVHGTNWETSDVTKIHAEDLEIVSTSNYTYLLTYSFPCQDLSLAGNKKGMTKGSGTRSGLLWEVERLLNECKELPQVLLMENVPQVHSKRNIEDFQKWISYLETRGYKNTWFDMNATQCNVAQNRKRCFMISTLPGYSFTIPTPIPLTKKMKDYLEPKVDEKFYLSDKMLQGFLKHNEHHMEKGTGFIWKPSDVEGNAKCLRANASLCPTDNTIPCFIKDQAKTVTETLDVAHTLKARDYKGFDNYGINAVIETVNIRQATKKGYIECEVGGVADLTYPNSKLRRGRVIDNGNTCPALTSNAMGACRIEKDETPAVDRCVQVGTLEMKGHESMKRVYSADACCPTINSMQGGNLQPKLEPKERFYKQAQETLLENDCKEGDVINAFNKTVQKDGVSPTITTRPEGFKTAILPITSDIRIRKLTPREYWRLMGFDDSDFDKAQQLNSNTQLYKQAGNSIVVDCLMAIMRNIEEE